MAPRYAYNLLNQKFGLLKAIERAPNTVEGKAQWRCVCACGKKHTIAASELKRKNRGIKSCGCLKKKQASDRLRTHGMSTHPVFHVWRAMLGRCTRPTHQAWKNYGGRGIKVCAPWRKAFFSFWKDMGPTYKKGLTLDRKNNDKGYYKSNCRWVTRRVQAQNKRKAVKIKTPNGVLNVSEASRQFHLNATTLLYRIKNNWPEDKLLLPADFRNKVRTQHEVC